MATEQTTYDAVIVGAGVSGSFIANELVQAGMTCVLLEAGRSFTKDTYPRKEIDANSLLYWGGGIELNTDASIGFLRPKAVGGGSIVNQALLDRFDDSAFDAWREESGVSFLTRRELDPWYDRAAAEISIQTVPEEYRNGNAEVFRKGFEHNGYRCAPLVRAQGDCRFADGNCCIECLMGCRIDSKQSTPVTVLKRAQEAGLHVVSEFEARQVEERNGTVTVGGVGADQSSTSYRGKILVLAAGAIGNSRLLLASGFAKRLPALGHNFYTHPQYMILGRYDEPINAQRGPLQSYKSDDPSFRRSGFKLENVFAPPVAIAMLLPGFGSAHLRCMKDITRLACIEVAVRDTNPGRVRLGRGGSVRIEKRLNDEDRRRRDRGRDAIRNIFLSTGAREIIDGGFAIGLHLMGGCNMGVDPAGSVVSPEFRLHGFHNLYVGDSSIFPNAPGINPSFTIMALSLKAADQIRGEVRA
ncbi:MAG: glucose-methanol-choline oxidoreductase [Acidobacteria bacterium RBG_16_68_9]|nr:MAG: glucose-methanol-choline oxidoreductase [Acidobacteria bacterium RBG_16_68_9]